MHRIIDDVRLALRHTRTRVGFTFVAVLSLALGIGANTAIFSLVNALLLRRPNIPHREQIVEVYVRFPNFPFAPFSYPDYVDFRAASRDVFSQVSLSQFGIVPRDVGDHIETLTAELVNGDYFPLLGLEPAVGRLLDRTDDVAAGAHPVVVLSYEYWRRAFGGDPAVLGRELQLGGRSYVIVGVAPKAYAGTVAGIAPLVYLPIKMLNQLQPSSADQLATRGNHSDFLKVRLVPGASLARARTMVETFTADMHRRFPNDWPPAQTLSVVPESQILVNPMIDGVVLPAVATLTIVVGLVLLVACANLASFLLAQARDRQREVAIRLALGATRVVLVRQMLIEAILLAAIGGAIGVALSRLALGALLRAQLPLPLPITLDVTLDAHILAFAVLASLGAGVLFGLLPALQATRTAIAETIKNENTGGSRGRRVTLRGALVVGEVAVSLLLLITAALFLRSFRARATVDPGFGKAPAGLVWFAIPADRYPVPRRLQLVERIEDRIRATPGVEAVGLIDNMLLNLLSEQDKPVNVAGFRPPKGQPGFQVMWSAIDSGFFDAAGVTLVSGRSITAADGPDAPRVVVINEAMAKQFWPTVDPIGRTVRVDTTQYRVVGVARTTKVRTLGEAPRPFMFLSFRQSSSETVMMVARSRGDAEAVATEMLHALHAVDPSLMVIQSKTMARHLATMMLPARLGAFAFALFAAVGLTLAVIGVYGVVSYAVARRTREVGIRVAVGADPTAVIQLLMREGMILVVIGGVVGLALGFAVTRVLAGLLYGVATLDPLTFVAAPILLVGVGAAACFIPARRATAIDPAVVLRTE